jgi:hypothetical protein
VVRGRNLIDRYPAIAVHGALIFALLGQGRTLGGEFDHYWTSALVCAWAVRAAIHRGDAAAAREHIIRATRLRPLLTYALPEGGEERNARSDGQRRRADTRTNQGIPSSSLWVTTRAWGRLS